MGSAAPDRLAIAPATPSSNKGCNSEVRAAGKAALILDLRLCTRADRSSLSRAFCAEDKKRSEASLIFSGSYHHLTCFYALIEFLLFIIGGFQ